jgi:glycosyltransferase involved in cell wall biosynthesis
VTSPPRLSVVVPAHNRAARLPALLDTLRAELARHGAAELLLVDSASSDATGSVARAAAAADPERIRALSARRPGACHARNLGAAAARAPLLVFVDDDVLPHPGCLAALEVAHADPSVHAAGGRIVLRLEAAPPPWLSHPFLSYLAGYDLGESPRDITQGGDALAPRSALMSVRRDVLLDLGGFCELFGPRGSRPMVGEEPELCRRIVARGGRILYVPDAGADHIVPARRLTADSLARRFFYQGVTEAFADIRFAGARAAWARLGRGLRGRLAGTAWDRTEHADGNATLAAFRRRQSLGYAAGVLVGSLRYRALRQRAA